MLITRKNEGSTVRLRNGKTATIVSYSTDGDDPYPVRLDHGDGGTHSATTQGYFYSDGKQDPFDVVSLEGQALSLTSASDTRRLARIVSVRITDALVQNLHYSENVGNLLFDRLVDSLEREPVSVLLDILEASKETE